MSIGILPAGSQGGDSDTICTTTIANALRTTGAKFLIRYISRTVPNHSGDLSAAERQNILRAGLAVGYVQHYPGNGWAPSAIRGSDYGGAAVANLVSIGASPGVNVWRDWEGLIVTSMTADCIADMNAWSQQIIAGGFIPGIYFGYDGVLNASDLYVRLICKHYWKSISRVVTPIVRGWQMVQFRAPSPFPGYDWDRDVVMTDMLGGTPIWDLP